MTRATVLTLLVWFVAACAAGNGHNLRGYWPAQSARGITVELRLDDASEVAGELLAVDDTALVVLTGDRGTVVPYHRIRRGIARTLRDVWVGRPLTPQREELRRHSRYPLGIPEAARRVLLSAGADGVAETLRGATRVYEDHRRAVGDGFRQVGPAFPLMGEHWVHVRRALSQLLDPRQPSLLSYAVVNGQRVLTGAGFALPIGRGEPTPAFPGGADAWHFHSGTIADESFGGDPAPAPGGMRLAVVHAWVWTVNPAGTFARDNHALPYVQAGVPVPANITVEAALGLAAAREGAAYYRARWTRAGFADSVVDQALRRHDADVSTLLRPDLEPAGRDLALAGRWGVLCARFNDCRQGHH